MSKSLKLVTPLVFILFCLALYFTSPPIEKENALLKGSSSTKEVLRVLTWDGYITKEDLREVNKVLDVQGYEYEVQIIQPNAIGARQMFELIRDNKCDVTFMTLFFIKMEQEQTSKLLQAINIRSPRLKNYQDLLPSLTHLPMGLNKKGLPLYIPWGGGAYGFYVDRNKVDKKDIPKTVNDLWSPKWNKKFSLNKSQEWYNIGLALMSLGKSPFYLYEMVQQGNTIEINALGDVNGPLQKKITSLYANTGHFWTSSPQFKNGLSIISSWGPKITLENNKGGNWQMIHFNEGHMVWLDTINFVKGLKGKKLEAAEIFANYLIGQKVQSRITSELSMVAASSKVMSNKILGPPSKIFKEHMFVPPYDAVTYKIMEEMTEKATIDSINN